MSTRTPSGSKNGPEKHVSFSDKLSTQSVSSPLPPAAKKGHMQTETPHEPEQIHHAFEKPVADPLAIGSPQFELALKLTHKKGPFSKRSNLQTAPVPVTLDLLAMRTGALNTLREVIRRALSVKGYIEHQDIDARALSTATILANGITVAIYLKIRAVNIQDVNHAQKFLKTPKVPTPFEVPMPYALAISHLGVHKVSSLAKPITLLPTLSAATTTYGLPQSQIWSQTQYTQAMEYAKSIGLSFAAVDNTVKLGSSWWLYQQEYEEDFFCLRCVLPEDNYTLATAALHTIFCASDAGSLLNVFADLSAFGTEDYGTMLRNPNPDVNLSSYYAVDAMPEQVWKVV